jgi:hypothetical protein
MSKIQELKLIQEGLKKLIQELSNLNIEHLIFIAQHLRIAPCYHSGIIAIIPYPGEYNMRTDGMGMIQNGNGWNGNDT